MPTRYLILRVDQPLDDIASIAAPLMWRKSEPGPSELSIEIDPGHETDLGRLQADPRNAAVLDADIVMSLVDPKSRKEANDAALGVTEISRVPKGLIEVGAHTSAYSGQGITVAVLDTGIDENHAAFAGLSLSKRDFTGEGATPDDVTDFDGHGTHCAGTICGREVDGIRVGVAPGISKLCVGKVLGSKGGTLEMILTALHWAIIEEKADVVSMSLGYDLANNTARLIQKGIDPAMATDVVLRQQKDIISGLSTLKAYLKSRSPNAVFVAATGNESRRPDFVLDAGLPASELLAVGAVVKQGDMWMIAEFSNGRAQLVAPGVDVYSAQKGGGWTLMSGTSMATPHVAGVAALWAEKTRVDGLWNVPDTVSSSLRVSARRQGLPNHDLAAIGSGLVQAP